MRKPIRKTKPSRRTRRAPSREPGVYVRPSAAEIRRAAAQAVSVARRQTDEDVERAMASDPDAAELDGTHAVPVRPGDVDMARIRSSLGLTQAGFAAATGIPHRLISDWEQGRKKPSAAARALLLLIDELGEDALKRLARRAAA